MRIVVIGTGYVGLVQGACLASLGHDVTCVDINTERVQLLQKGEIPFFEKDLPELVLQGVDSRTLRFSSDLKEALAVMPQIVFICVGTPTAEDGSANLSAVQAVAESLGPLLTSQTIVVTKSTVPVGTGEKVLTWMGRDDISVASNPEFLREGRAVQDFFHPDRIVIGVEDDNAEQALQQLYAGIDTDVLVMNRASAELAKYAANSMLALRLSFMNEIANIADVTGANIQDIERSMGHDSRIGAKFLRAGAGFGGSCFPKDVMALEYTAQEAGYTPRLIAPIIAVNNDQPGRFVQKVIEQIGSVKGKTCAVWGLAFNKGTDDVRESPAIAIIEHILHAGGHIQAYDPRAVETAKHILGDTINYAASMEDALQSADILLVLTEWPEFSSADWSSVKQSLHSPVICDAKNFLPHAQLAELGFQVIAMGIPTQK